jgi:hypothetical protein
MDNNRNNLGRFVKGHSGAKPKGAISKNTRKYIAYIDEILKLLEANLTENIENLRPKEQVHLWMGLQKIKNAHELKELVEADPPPKEPMQITFEVIGRNGEVVDTIYPKNYIAPEHETPL